MFSYGGQHHAPHLNPHSHNNNHHGGRSRRAPRMSASQQHKQFRQVRTPKEFVVEPPTLIAFRRDFEAARSFDFEDDELFCPFHLLTEDDVSQMTLPLPHRDICHSALSSQHALTHDEQLHSIHSSGSDRSSLSSGSPEQSPLQHQLQPTPSFVLSSAPNPYTPANFQSNNSSQPKLHQPLAQRTRNAIPIVDPSTRAVASPPPSVSPNRQMQQQYRRW
ncbi:hypothetical protein CC80DRAFT_144939 [Byssothecium circinans]|uniref:Uncharacterized protein n=1 Tax=Byssothecium circinans TaxID=147558 RepID=A0A6A5TNN1_9PLEO|nr:hypothetical protein CC80DRAFT_144939 [Byssothecium circinans]